MTIDFKDLIRQLGDRANRLKDQIQTEEATKNALIMPFIQALGYDVFNPLEVVPEFVADVGIKKGEKIDYAIMREGVPVILVECKHWAQKLDLHDGQLLRYFHVSKAKFAILTNGIAYRFYSDIVEPNKMDEKPFLEFLINDMRDNQLDELKKFHKSYFDISSIITTASELKYMTELKSLISSEFVNPSDALVKHFATQVYSGKVTAKVLEQFQELTKKSLNQFINDIITDRLRSALKQETQQMESPDEPEMEEAKQPSNQVITTAEEMEAFYVVKSMVRQTIEPQRIVYRDAQSYFAILLDDNNRKPLCRLYLGEKRKLIGLFDAHKKETRHELASLEDIYAHADAILETIAMYDQK